MRKEYDFSKLKGIKNPLSKSLLQGYFMRMNMHEQDETEPAPVELGDFGGPFSEEKQHSHGDTHGQGQGDDVRETVGNG